MIHHAWLEGITVQGEAHAIRAAEEAENKAKLLAAESSAEPASSSGAAKIEDANEKRANGLGLVPTASDEADALKPVHSGENSPTQPERSPSSPQASRAANTHNQTASSSKSKSKSKGKPDPTSPVEGRNGASPSRSQRLVSAT